MGLRTGADYVAALRDGRRVFQGGRRIEDVASQPGFAGTVRTVASLYDLQHDPSCRDRLSIELEDGERIPTRYHPPRTPEELAAKRRGAEIWADRTLGQLGRFPDYCAEIVVGLLGLADDLGRVDPRLAERARAYHRHCASRDLYLTHALNDQFHDRSRPVGQQDDPDLVLRVVRETEDGPIVRGLRNLATQAPLCDEVLVHPNTPRLADEQDYALAFAIPLNSAGLNVVCRDLYAEHADPERLPLTTRYDEVDASLIFDDVLVPWERVFVYRDPALAARYHAGITRWSVYVQMIRQVVRLEVGIGVATLLSRWAGRDTNPATRAQIGQLIADVEVLRACITAAEHAASRQPNGLWAPDIRHSYRLHGIEASDRAERLLEETLTSLLIVTGGPTDLEHPEIGGLMERYFRSRAPSTREHLRLLAVATDLVQSAYANRCALYERLWGGEPNTIRQTAFARANLSAYTDRVERFLEGWDKTTSLAGGQRASSVIR